VNGGDNDWLVATVLFDVDSMMTTVSRVVSTVDFSQSVSLVQQTAAANSCFS